MPSENEPSTRRQRKPRAANWTTPETVELLQLRFQTEEILSGFINQGNKDDEKKNWMMVAAELSTNRDWESCRSRLKTLTAQYKKLMKEDLRTGNNTEDVIEYPPYWDTMLECLGPFSGLCGNAIADSERHLTTACSSAVTNGTSEDTEVDPEEGQIESNSGDLAPPHQVTTVQPAVVHTQSLGKRTSVFSPNKPTSSKRTKKNCDLSNLASSVSTLVEHIIGKSDSQSSNDSASVQADLESVREHVALMGTRVTQLEAKIDTVAEQVAASVKEAVLGSISNFFMQQ
ncbi:hypothetical protein DVH05_025356 [Phytophthora capsici]|nr:hypothetical protein DVH05_025356 [Phytophthora capsici]